MTSSQPHNNQDLFPGSLQTFYELQFLPPSFWSSPHTTLFAPFTYLFFPTSWKLSWCFRVSFLHSVTVLYTYTACLEILLSLFKKVDKLGWKRYPCQLQLSWRMDGNNIFVFVTAIRKIYSCCFSINHYGLSETKHFVKISSEGRSGFIPFSRASVKNEPKWFWLEFNLVLPISFSMPINNDSNCTSSWKILAFELITFINFQCTCG